MSLKIEGVLRVNIWRLLDDGVEGPLRYGIHRAFKHSDNELNDATIERIVNAQHDALMNWFSETFAFDDGNDGGT